MLAHIRSKNITAQNEIIYDECNMTSVPEICAITLQRSRMLSTDGVDLLHEEPWKINRRLLLKD